MVDHRNPWVVAGLTVAAFVGSLVLAVNLGAPAWVTSVIQAVFTGAFIAQMTSVMARSVAQSRAQGAVFAQPLWYLVLGLVAFVGIPTLFYFCWTTGDRAPLWAEAGLGLLWYGSLIMVLDWVRGRHRWTDSGLVLGSAFHGPTPLTWDEIRRVRYSAFLQAFRLETDRGARWLWPTFRGAAEFFTRFLASVAPDRFQPAALTAMRERAGSA